ncbi:MAG: hypothetical protein LW835_03470 [Burkholderiaceae bacterium]|nr:hypothetical protein [Burkholderiaceae bacterium]
MRQRQGGILWHTQGSGKSIVMLLLAKWMNEGSAAPRTRTRRLRCWGAASK